MDSDGLVIMGYESYNGLWYNGLHGIMGIMGYGKWFVMVIMSFVLVGVFGVVFLVLMCTTACCCCYHHEVRMNYIMMLVTTQRSWFGKQRSLPRRTKNMLFVLPSCTMNCLLDLTWLSRNRVHHLQQGRLNMQTTFGNIFSFHIFDHFSTER